ncbi:hypothetical protein N7638_17495 [Achromobacter mucicolens]|uniref:hypothetical protein n=1 Tax=Achromobacter TaxID=222 RepID=UPI0015815597|nr:MULTISPECIES: hypothetical protein [Achromobacter]MDG9969839.1 hypothetical protein [Achromobacter mucicolens]
MLHVSPLSFFASQLLATEANGQRRIAIARKQVNRIDIVDMSISYRLWKQRVDESCVQLTRRDEAPPFGTGRRAIVMAGLRTLNTESLVLQPGARDSSDGQLGPLKARDPREPPQAIFTKVGYRRA